MLTPPLKGDPLGEFHSQQHPHRPGDWRRRDDIKSTNFDQRENTVDEGGRRREEEEEVGLLRAKDVVSGRRALCLHTLLLG